MLTNTAACVAVLGFAVPNPVREVDTKQPALYSNTQPSVATNATHSQFCIYDLASKNYVLSKPILLTISHPDDDGYVVSFPEAEIQVAGETPDEAVNWIKSSIVTIFEEFKSAKVLGPLAKRQMTVLEKYLGAKSTSET